MTTITPNIKRAPSKVFESGCLFRFSLPPFNCDTVSEGRGGEEEGNLDKMRWNVYSYENIFILFLTHHGYSAF
jgi:hypothetical protein